MSRTLIQRLWKFLLVMVVQVLLLNHIHLLGYVCPVIIAYITMNFNRGSNRVLLLLWGFAAGLVYDVFSNTMGVGMASATLLAMLQPTLLGLFTPRDAADDMEPSMRTMGAQRWLTYAFFSMLIFHIVFYALDALTLGNLWLTLAAMGIGTAAAWVIVALAQSFIVNKKTT